MKSLKRIRMEDILLSLCLITTAVAIIVLHLDNPFHDTEPRPIDSYSCIDGTMHVLKGDEWVKLERSSEMLTSMCRRSEFNLPMEK